MAAHVAGRVALLGCGYWGKNLARTFHQLGALALVGDVTAQGRQQAAQVAPGVAVAESFDDLLHHPCQAVILATPAPTHFTLAAQALEAGKDVFVEKPLALTYEEGHRLVQLAKQKNRILMVGHVLEYHPALGKLQDLLTSGTLGPLYYLYSHRLSLGKVRTQENVLWSFATHDVALALRLVGRLPIQVSAWGGCHLQPNIADTAVVHLEFDQGVQAHVFVSWLHPFKEHRLVVVGARRMASLDDVAKKLLLHDSRVDLFHDQQPIPVAGECTSVEFPAGEPLRLECEAFLESIRTRQEPRTGGTSALRVLRVLQAAQQSLDAHGKPVALASEVTA